MAAPTKSLFSVDTPPPISEGMAVDAALQGIHAWAHTFESLEAYQRDYQAPSSSLDVGKLVEDVKKLLRRDMLLMSKYSGLSLVLTGLAIPIKVCGVELPHTVTFLAHTSQGMHASLRLELNATLDARDVDMLHMLAPALAVFMREHAAQSGSPACLAALGEATKVPVVPPAMLEAARQLPHKNFNADTHVGEVVVAARRALRETGYRVPNLEYVKLRGTSLEQWLSVSEVSIRSIAAMEEEMQGEVRRMKRMIDESFDQMVGRTKISRMQLLNSIARGGA